MHGNQIAETVRIQTVDLPRPVQFEGKRNRVSRKHPSALIHIGTGNTDRTSDDLTRANFKPAIKAQIQRNGRDNGDKYRGDGRNQREQTDNADVQPRRCPALAARLQNDPDLAPDQEHQYPRQEAVDHQRGGYHLIAGLDRREAAENEERGRTRDQKCNDRQKSKPTGHIVLFTAADAGWRLSHFGFSRAIGRNQGHRRRTGLCVGIGHSLSEPDPVAG